MRWGWMGSGRDGRPEGRRCRAALLVPTIGASVLFALAVGAVPASAANNGKFAIEPADASTSTRQFFTPVLQPGVQSSDSVAVINETASPVTLRLYASDALTTRDGVFSIEPDFKPKRAMGAWIHLPASRVTVPARSADVVHFTYNPPSTVTPGDYAGGIVAEQTSGPLVGKRSLKVEALEAVGTAVFGSIPGALHPRLAVTAVSVATSRSLASQFGGAVDATVTYSVTNTGNETLTPAATVSLSPLLGGKKTVHVHLPQILPGSTVTLSHTFDGVVPFGSLSASVQVRAAGVSASGGGSTAVVPWGIVVVLAVVVLALLLRRRRTVRRRRQGPGGAKPPPDHAGPPPGPDREVTPAAVGGGPPDAAPPP
jgi:hypothetical protein